MTSATVTERKADDVTREEATGAKAPARRTIVPDYLLHRTDEAFFIRTELPGVTTSGLDIQLKDRLLTVKGETQPVSFEGFNKVYGEYSTVNYAAGFRISDDIDEQGISAKLTNGILTINLPKAKERLSRNIKVSAS